MAFNVGKQQLLPKRRKEHTLFQKALRVINVPLNVSAGVAEELKRRSKGYYPHPLIKAAKQGIERRMTYGDIVDNKLLAFTLDIFGDPLTYIPSGVFVKGWKGGKILSKTFIGKPLKYTARGIKAARGPDLEVAVDGLRRWVGKAFIKNYELGRVAGKQYIKFQKELYSELETAPGVVGKAVMDKINELVPSSREQFKIFNLLERSPIGSRKAWAKIIHNDPEAQKWAQELASLSKGGKKAYKYAVKLLEDLEKIKIEAGLLTTEHAENFLKLGVRYVPRIRWTKYHAIQEAEGMIKAIKSGDVSVLAQMRKAFPDIKNIEELKTRAIKDLNRWLSEIKEMPTAFTAEGLEKIRKGLSFTYPRKTQGVLEGGAKLADVLGIHVAEVGKGVATQKYIKSMVEELKRERLLFPKAALGDLEALEKELVERVGKSRAVEIMKSGWTSLDELGIEGLEGMIAPKAIGDEVKQVFQKYASPDVAEDFLGKFRRVQSIWKAWTLSIFPSYHFRNTISNMWNNFLAGMGPESARFYRKAMMLQVKKAKNILSEAEKKLLDEAIEDRVLRSGFLVSEAGEAAIRSADIYSWPLRWVDPARNRAVQFGFKTGSAIEDNARLAHYLWARHSKGLAREKAAESVQKFLFDYKYGLTPFEEKYFRNFLAPFYTWTRFNLPLQLEMLATKPGRVAVFVKGSREWENQFGGPDPEETFMADWMKRAIKVRWRWNKDKKTYEYFMLGNWLPTADVNKITNIKEFRDMLLNLTSPFAKLPIEIVFNYNLFRKRPVKAFKGERVRVLGIPVEPYIAHLSRSVRAINEADYVVDAFYTKTGKSTKLAAFWRLLVGKIYPYRPEDQAKWWDWQMRKRAGELKSIQRYYKRKKLDHNVKVLERLIGDLEVERKFYQGMVKNGKRRKR
jgi:hypothetical protein